MRNLFFSRWHNRLRISHQTPLALFLFTHVKSSVIKELQIGFMAFFTERLWFKIYKKNVNDESEIVCLLLVLVIFIFIFLILIVLWTSTAHTRERIAMANQKDSSQLWLWKLCKQAGTHTHTQSTKWIWNCGLFRVQTEWDFFWAKKRSIRLISSVFGTWKRIEAKRNFFLALNLWILPDFFFLSF